MGMSVRRGLAFDVLALLALAGAASCASQEDAQVSAPVVLGMNDNIAPFYKDDEVSLYEVSIPVALPMRKPTDGERNALAKDPLYGRAPFFKANDARITVRFTLSNLDDEPRT